MFPETECFEDVFKRALLPAKILGLVPFSIIEGKSKTSLLTLYSFSIVLLSAFLSYTFSHPEMPNKNVFIAQIFNLIRRLLSPLQLTINFAEVYILRHNLTTILLTMERIHSELVSRGGRPDYKSPKLGILVFVTSCTATTVLELYMIKPNISEVLLLLMNGIVLSTNLHSVISLLALVESQFKTLRHMLLRDSTTPDMPHSILRFQLFATSHCALVTCCERINNIFHFQLLYIFSNHFITACLAMSFALIFCRDFNLDSLYPAKISHCILTVVSCLECVFLLANRCTSVRDEADKFSTLLHELMLGDKTNKIFNNEKLRLHMAVRRSVVFTAFGFFPIGYELIHSMVAAVATYLVTLIQFSQASTDDANPSN